MKVFTLLSQSDPSVVAKPTKSDQSSTKCLAGLRFAIAALFMFASFVSLRAVAQTQLAAWSFPTTSAAPSTPTSFAADFGSQSGTATLYADGSNGSSSFTQSGNPELTMFAGSTLNDPKGTPNNTGALSPANASANGKSFVIKLSMAGFENPELTYATRGTNTGFTTHTWAYSTDGINFTDISTITGRTNNSFTVQTVDFSSANSLDNAQNVYFKVTFTGATNATGNNRFDNIQIEATAGSFAPVVTASTFNGTMNASASFQVLATNSPTSYALFSGSLPSGLNLNTTTGEISGTPSAAGNFTFQVTATNGGGTSSPAQIEIDIAKADQTISFGALSDKQEGDPDFSLSATASSGLTVSYSSSDALVATVSGNMVHIVGPGTVTITASQAGDANYNAATSVDQSFNVTSGQLQDQTISFGPLSPVTYGDADFTLTATASSGLPVTYTSSDPSVATVSGNTIHINMPGMATVTARQAGDGTYNPAPDVEQSLVVNTKALTVTGASVDSKTYDGNTNATISGATLVGVVGGDDVSINGTAGTFADANAGTGIAVTANLTLAGADMANYSLTQPSGLTGTINKADQTITFNGPLPDQMAGEPDFSLTATASSGLPVTFTSTTPSVATVTNAGLVHIVAVGSTFFVASQAGDGNYNPATDVQQQQTIIPLAPVSIWTNPITGTNPGLSNPYTAGQTVDPSLTVSGIGHSATTTGTSANDRYNVNGWDAVSFDNTRYIEWTLTPANGDAINFSSLIYSSQKSGSGPGNFAIRSSADNFATDIANPGATGTTLSLAGAQFQGVASAITFRLYGWGATGPGGTFSVNDFTFTGNIVTAPPQVTVAVTNRSACGPDDGAISTSVSNGTPPYTYSWTGLSGSGAGIPYSAGNVSGISGLNYGFYNVTVTDANQVSVTVSNIHVGKAFLPVITHNGQASSACGNTATLIIYASAGVSPYTYSVDGVTYQATNTFTDLAAGPMTIYVKDAAGCVGTKNYTILAAAPITLNPYVSPASTCGADGSITVYRSGGNPPYTYSIDGVNYQPGNLFSGLAGNSSQTVYVKDSKGCVASSTVTVTQGAAISVSTQKSNTSACINNGTITVTATGGTGVYQYSLDNLNFQATPLFTDLPAGNWVVYVKDSKACTGTANVTINTVVINVNASATAASDCSASDGVIHVFPAGGGNGPFTYSIDGNNYQASNSFTGLTPGYYSVYVKDANTCTGVYEDLFVGPFCSREAVSRKPNNGGVSVKVFPNPSNHEFMITMKGFDLNRKVSVMVTDVLGRRVAQYETNAPQIMIGNKLQAGTYQVQLVQGNSRQSLTIVKE